MQRLIRYDIRHLVSWWDMAGCNSFASWILMLAKKYKKQLFYFSTFAHLQWNKINAKRSIYFTFILFYVRCADGTSLALYKIRNMAEFKPLLGRPRPSFYSFCSTGPPQGSPTAQSATQLSGTNSPGSMAIKGSVAVQHKTAWSEIPH